MRQVYFDSYSISDTRKATSKTPRRRVGKGEPVESIWLDYNPRKLSWLLLPISANHKSHLCIFHIPKRRHHTTQTCSNTKWTSAEGTRQQCGDKATECPQPMRRLTQSLCSMCTTKKGIEQHLCSIWHRQLHTIILFLHSANVINQVMMASPISGRTVIDINATVRKHQNIIPRPVGCSWTEWLWYGGILFSNWQMDHTGNPAFMAPHRAHSVFSDTCQNY